MATYNNYQNGVDISSYFLNLAPNLDIFDYIEKCFYDNSDQTYISKKGYNVFYRNNATVNTPVALEWRRCLMRVTKSTTIIGQSDTLAVNLEKGDANFSYYALYNDNENVSFTVDTSDEIYGVLF